MGSALGSAKRSLEANQMADTLTFTLRLYDPLEKKDATKSASWVSVEIVREDLTMDEGHFIEKYVRPSLGQLKQLALTTL